MRAVKARVLTASRCPKIIIQTEFPCHLQKDLCLVYLWHANIVCNFFLRGQSSWKGTCLNGRVNTEKKPFLLSSGYIQQHLVWGRGEGAWSLTADQRLPLTLGLQTSASQTGWKWALFGILWRQCQELFSKEVICKGWFLPQTLLTTEADNFVCVPLPEEKHLSGQLSDLYACQKLSKRCWLQRPFLGQGEYLKRLFLRALFIFLTWVEG